MFACEMSVESFRIVEREAATDERAADRIIAIVYGSNVLAQFVAVTQFVEFLCWSWKSAGQSLSTFSNPLSRH
jgi:hypothetical protein